MPAAYLDKTLIYPNLDGKDTPFSNRCKISSGYLNSVTVPPYNFKTNMHNMKFMESNHVQNVKVLCNELASLQQQSREYGVSCFHRVVNRIESERVGIIRRSKCALAVLFYHRYTSCNIVKEAFHFFSLI